MESSRMICKYLVKINNYVNRLYLFLILLQKRLNKLPQISINIINVVKVNNIINFSHKKAFFY